jgi:DNA polymerase III alpha subunit
VSDSQIPEYIKIRSFLWANIPVLLESASARKEASKNDSDDLFGDGSVEESSLISRIPWQKDYPIKFKFDILTDERETLGIYVSGNPLEDFLPILEWVKQATLFDDINLILVEKIRKIFTRAGGMMLAIQLTTPFESLEGIIFPKNAGKFSSILEEKQLYWVFGNIKRKEKKEEKAESDSTPEYDEKPKMMLSNLVPFNSGVLELINSSELSLSDKRREALKDINWQEIQQNPSLFWESHQVEKSNANNETEPEPKILKIPKELGADGLRELKLKLKNHHIPGGLVVVVELETSSGWKKARGTFWIPTQDLEFFKKYLQS